jgi:protein gp37
VTGCNKVSPGYARCYAETFAERWRGFPGHPYEQGFALKLWPQCLEQPTDWGRPKSDGSMRGRGRAAGA